MTSIKERDPEWDALPPKTPSAIVALLRRCLQKSPDRRPATIAEVREIVEQSQRQGSRWALVAATVGVAVLAAAIIWTWRTLGQQSSPIRVPTMTRLTADSGLTAKPAFLVPPTDPPCPHRAGGARLSPSTGNARCAEHTGTISDDPTIIEAKISLVRNGKHGYADWDVKSRTVGILGIGLASAVLASAQYGGRVGDAVIYVVTAVGKPDFITVPSTTVNTATGFITEDPTQLFDEPFGPDFPGESRRKMHAADGDVFNLIVEREGISSPYQYLQGPVKVMISQGLLRLYPPNEPPVDTPVGFYAPFPDTIDFGPNRPNLPGTILFWTNFPRFPVATIAPVGYHSPALPANFSNGIDFLLSIGTFVGILPWRSLNTVYPNSGWAQGIDSKLVDDDTALGVRVQILRLRPGRKTPTFKVNANMHLWVLNGSVTITPSGGGQPTVIANPGCVQPCPGTVYAFVPNGYALSLANPIAYDGTFTIP